MCRTKTIVSLVILILMRAMCHAQAQAPLQIITVDGVEMVAGHVRVMMDTPWFAEADLPAGFQIAHRFVTPRSWQAASMMSRPARGTTNVMRAHERLARCAVLRYEGTADPRSVSAQLRKYPSVEYAEPWYVLATQWTPNDAEFSQQTGLQVAQFPLAWDLVQGDSNQVIAIIDNGVDQTHEDLRPNIWINQAEVPGNRIDDDGNGVVDDYNGANLTWLFDGTEPGNTANVGQQGHGTSVAGIVGAATNNVLGIAGAGNRCKIFPIKTALRNTGGILFGYEAMIYAAEMGFAVANCSFGTQNDANMPKPYSHIDKAVIDYCNALGMVVVASAGNHGNGVGGSGWRQFNYPSGYDGVIGASETTPEDKVTTTSGLLGNGLVCAPGNGALTTLYGGGYSSSGISGTSFAAPFVAGAAALVRTRWPQLNTRQVGTHLRRTAIEIGQLNPFYPNVVPPRLNAYQAVLQDPMQRPGFRLKQVVMTTKEGVPLTRYRAGDTVLLHFDVVNDLGPSSQLLCSAEINDNPGWTATLSTNQVRVDAVPSGGEVRIGPFTLIVETTNREPLMVMVHLEDDSGVDVVVAYIPQPSVMSTMSNNQLRYSIGDNGTFGFATSQWANTIAEGGGLGWLEVQQDLGWYSGFMLTENLSRVVRAYDNHADPTDFEVEKPFTAPEQNRGVMVDVSHPNQIGVRISQRCTFPGPDVPSTVISIEVENRSGNVLRDVSAGYLFDFDIGPSGLDNTVRLAPECIPTSMRSTGEALMFQRQNFPIAIACAAVSAEPSVQPQCAGMMLYEYAQDLDDANAITLLNSGTSIQTTRAGDACCAIGMKFPGELQPGEKRSFMVVIGVGSSADEASRVVRETIATPNSVTEARAVQMQVWPNPTQDGITATSSVPFDRVMIVDVHGSTVYEQNTDCVMTATVNLQHLSPGVYACRVRTSSGLVTLPFVINR